MLLQRYLQMVPRYARRLAPRTLYYQLIASNIVLLSLITLVLVWAGTAQNIQLKIEKKLEQYQYYTTLIAKLVDATSQLKSIGEVKQQLQLLVLHPEVAAVQIVNSERNELIHLSKENTTDNESASSSVVLKEYHPRVGRAYLTEKFVIVEHSLAVGEAGAMVKVYFNRTSFLTTKTTAFKQGITIMLLGVLLSIIVVRKVLGGPMSALRRASDFAEWLDFSQGNHVVVDHAPREIQQLAASLNKVSEKLYKQNLADKSNKLLVSAIGYIQNRYVAGEAEKTLFGDMILKSIQLTASEYGFIGDVLYSEKKQPYLKIRSFSNLNWNVRTETFFEKYAPPELEFKNTNNLFGSVLQTGKPAISNDVARDPRSRGLPPGHPDLRCFLGIPLFYRNKLIALIGLANRKGGYDKDIVEYLQPLLEVYGGIISAFKENQFRNKMQLALQDNEARLRTIFETVSDSIITFNNVGFVETINPATAATFGYLEEEIVNAHISRFLPGLFGSDTVLPQHGLTFNDVLETIGVRKDGSSFPVEATVNKFTLHDEKLYTVTLRDVSQQKQVESKLRHSENTLIEAQEMAHLGSWEYNFNTKNFNYTDYVARIFGFQDNKDFFQNILDLTNSEDKAILAAAFKAAVEYKSAFRQEFRLISNKGKERCICIQAKSSCDTRDQSQILVGTVQDITSIKEVLRNKDEFFTSLSEEIRSPLASIRGSIGFLSGAAKDHISEREKRLLDTVYENTDKLLVLINEILDIENIETGKSTFDMELMDFNALVPQIEMTARGYEKRYEVNCEVISGVKKVFLFGDQYRLLQVINSLISNAAKHSPAGGKITISISVYANKLRLAVSDQGAGIPLQIADKLFNRYLRHWQEPSAQEGTGLSLCAAKTIVERHGGVIGFRSVVDKGTTFSVDLPLPLQNVAVLSR